MKISDINETYVDSPLKSELEGNSFCEGESGLENENTLNRLVMRLPTQWQFSYKTNRYHKRK